jgi:hypothetical protein
MLRDDGVSMLERGRSGGASPVPEPTRSIVFCQGWQGSSPRYSHAALWVKGPVHLRLSARKPVRTVVTVDGTPVHAQRVARPVVVRVGSSGWHLVGVDVASAANGLRVVPASA